MSNLSHDCLQFVCYPRVTVEPRVTVALQKCDESVPVPVQRVSVKKKLLYVPFGGVHFKAVGSIVLLLPRLVSLAFQSSIRSCLFNTRCFPFQYLSI